MKDKIKLEVENINRILIEENPCNDWHKGRHSALRGVKVKLESILNGETVKHKETCMFCGSLDIKEDSELNKPCRHCGHWAS